MSQIFFSRLQCLIIADAAIHAVPEFSTVDVKFYGQFFDYTTILLFK